MKHLTRITRIITGIVFVFSGIVKGIDPLGTSIKLSEYFDVFHLGFMDTLSLPMALLLCAVEFIAGFMLLTDSFTTAASWMAALFMALFTPLTLVLALFNPVTDCGCFGDAIHFTNWQTFIKNVALTLIVIYVFIHRDIQVSSPRRLREVMTVICGSSLFFVFISYNLTFLPVIDFRPYKPGTDIMQAMTIPPGAPADEYDIRFIYEKDGVKKEFTLDNYPADDTTWTFVDQNSVLVSKGYVPPVHDFSLITADGYDITTDILEDEGYTVLMIIPEIKKAREREIKEGIDSGMVYQKHGTGFFLVTSGRQDEVERRVQGVETLFADQTTLLTMIRSNPGYVLLHKGTIIAKWSHNDMPAAGKVAENPSAYAVKTIYDTKVKYAAFFIALLILSIYLISELSKTNNTNYLTKKKS